MSEINWPNKVREYSEPVSQQGMEVEEEPLVTPVTMEEEQLSTPTTSPLTEALQMPKHSTPDYTVIQASQILAEKQPDNTPISPESENAMQAEEPHIPLQHDVCSHLTSKESPSPPTIPVFQDSPAIPVFQDSPAIPVFQDSPDPSAIPVFQDSPAPQQPTHNHQAPNISPSPPAPSFHVLSDYPPPQSQPAGFTMFADSPEQSPRSTAEPSRAPFTTRPDYEASPPQSRPVFTAPDFSTPTHPLRPVISAPDFFTPTPSTVEPSPPDAPPPTTILAPGGFSVFSEGNRCFFFLFFLVCVCVYDTLEYLLVQSPPMRHQEYRFLYSLSPHNRYLWILLLFHMYHVL